MLFQLLIPTTSFFNIQSVTSGGQQPVFVREIFFNYIDVVETGLTASIFPYFIAFFSAYCW
jgi:hypothetical protein